MPSLYDSRSLTSAINKIKVPNSFILDNVFKKREFHQSDKIDIEIYTGSEKIAQIISNENPIPKNVNKSTRKVVTVSLPRTFESKIFTAQQLLDYTAIGSLYNEAERGKMQKEFILNELDDLKHRVYRLREKLGMEGLSTGKITTTQDGVDYEVDFKFETGKQLISLTGANLWSATDCDPAVKLRLYKSQIAKLSGQAPSLLLLGSSAAEAFVSNQQVRDTLHNNNLKAGAIDLTQTDPSAIYLGKFLGLDVWEYTQQYVNEAGTATDMLATDRAVLVAPSNDFRLHYGPAYRIENQAGVPKVGEFLIEIDPKSSNQVLQWNCEQKSLPTIHDPGCVVSVKVV